MTHFALGYGFLVPIASLSATQQARLVRALAPFLDGDGLFCWSALLMNREGSDGNGCHHLGLGPDMGSPEEHAHGQRGNSGGLPTRDPAPQGRWTVLRTTPHTRSDYDFLVHTQTLVQFNAQSRKGLCGTGARIPSYVLKSVENISLDIWIDTTLISKTLGHFFADQTPQHGIHAFFYAASTPTDDV